MSTHAVYVRLPERELRRLAEAPAALAGLDVAAALADGRAIDLGRGWDELGCLLEGGISTPASGPTVGDDVFHAEETQTWSAVTPARVASIAAELAEMTPEVFLGLYQVGDDGTAEGPLDEHTGAWADRARLLYEKLVRLRAHYEAARTRGEAMLVRIAKR
jgi:hypothetical protein